MPLLQTLRFITSQPLNKRRKFDAIVRFAKWQIGSRLVPGAVVCDWVNGTRFLVKPGETGLTGNIYAGLHEFADMAFLLHVLRADDLFVDVGANVGSYTILACGAVGAMGYAFEPVSETHRRLLDNIRINNLDSRVQVQNAGVGGANGKMAFTIGLDTMNHAVTNAERHDGSVQVQVVTLDEALEINAPTLMKIDVEGYETPVLQGAKRILSNPLLHSVIMEINGSGSRYGFDESAILDEMSDYGFKTYCYDPITRNLVNLNGKNLDSGNTIFIRNEGFVLDRIKNAPRIPVLGVTI